MKEKKKSSFGESLALAVFVVIWSGGIIWTGKNALDGYGEWWQTVGFFLFSVILFLGLGYMLYKMQREDEP